MRDDDVDEVVAAMGARIAAARERRGDTLTDVSRATGIPLSTLSRVENGRRKPNLELLLRLAKAYDTPLNELAGTAPAAAREACGPPRRRPSSDKAVLPLTRFVGGLHAHKHVLPATGDQPSRPRQSSHEGHEWLCVLSGRLWLALGEHDLVLTAGEVAEFDTRTPHGVANAGSGGPVEYLVMFGPQGERLRPRVTADSGPLRGA
ncbi:XRE family transcriptional regulator [Streptomyces spectabilis]|uniref:Transcriptional regulator with XRE-family HTH domain n=1 Tax=Streptomyces spectabilis TaxID=68270 RepID=A0A5P2XKW5_STRST|nr:helix-turn-helix transcriptional regulator [Streptomyces spectabilis]MBB5102557.1 transcriptional regulator with XRE-family HTH domain [Streptomyces spectabilis]MCI3907597.1 helix-turn-helix transcriptional regulator [Streptomyces spectabilis]QEV64284.1 XRE family transcriptional regulator [Streptomyces spectabilis]GGV31157.1 XRE family transcriptional regulator [Streptomyces spectabilis]